MSSFSESGFYARTQPEIYDDYKTAGSGVLEEINLGPGSTLFQLAKIVGAREREMELMLEQMVSGLSIYTAQGVFLEKLCNDKGIFRKGPQKAGGYVNVTFDAPGKNDTPVDLLGTYFETSDGKKFYRSETGISQKTYHYIPIVRSTQNYDGLPSPFVSIEGTGYVDSNQDGNGTAYTGADVTFNSEQQIFRWLSTANNTPTTGSTYYVGISGQSVTVKTDVAAETEGTGYNVGANSVTEWGNNTTLPTDASVNNPEDLTGGAMWEKYEDLRARGIKAINRQYTTEKIRDMCENINGVRSVYVYQATGPDIQSFTGSWDLEKSNYQNGIHVTGFYSGADAQANYVSGSIYGQAFWPGNGILSLKKVKFYGRRVGFPPPMELGLRKPPSDEYETSGIFDTYDVEPPASTWQDMIVDIKYLDLDPNTEYVLDLWCSEKSGATGTAYWTSNYWEIATGDVTSGTLGDGDTYTGLLTLGRNAIGTGVNSIFQTRYGGAAINIDVAVKDGYTYSDIEDQIDEKLDWVSGSGFVPIGIDYSINQATPVYIYYSVTAYLEAGQSVSTTSVQDDCDDDIENYVEGLLPGENVVYSQMYKNIINHPKVWRLDDLEIWESGGAHSTGIDIAIDEGEVAVFGGSTFNKG